MGTSFKKFVALYALLAACGFLAGRSFARDWTDVAPGVRAEWIGAGEDSNPGEAVTGPAPYFRTEFTVRKKVRKATAYISGLGFYELYLNGVKAGDHVLAPAVTNYDRRGLDDMLYHFDDKSSQRVLYNVLDVTGMIHKGANAAGVLLGNGWYNQRDRTVEGKMWYDTPRMICMIELEYEDGTADSVISGEHWKTSSGALLHDGIFTGEIYDARLELSGWTEAGYDDSGWKNAALVRPPTGEMTEQYAPYDKVTAVFKPVSFERKNDSTYLYTFPEMLSGWVCLKVRGEAGDEIRMRFVGEENEDFGQKDIYILRGGKQETWKPRFTWHAFRSVEVVSSDVVMKPGSLVAEAVNTELHRTGSFSCSNELLNRINEAYVRTQRNNFHGSVSSDCPHRERLAYTGDAQVIAESSIYSFDMRDIYRKWFDDMADARNHVSGYVPHTAPFGGGGGGPAWGSAYVIMPWAYYCHYGDVSVLAEHYEGMNSWVEYLGTRTDDRGIVVREEPGGWCLGDWCIPGQVEIPAELVNTAYYHHVSAIMAKVASVLGRNDDAERFARLCRTVRDNFNAVFFDDATGRYWEGRQGADVFPLAFGMAPEGREKDVLASLLGNLESTDYHFDTGILATPLLLQVLTVNGRADVAYRLMAQRDGVGFGYLMDDRYSCLWETWEGNASMCHPMFGSVVAWFYGYLAGIRYDDAAPGMRSVVIEPHPVGDLTSCSASCMTGCGTVSSSWSLKGDRFRLKVRLPEGVFATVVLPDGRRIVAGAGRHVFVSEIR